MILMVAEPPRRVPVDEAAAHLAELLDAVEAGETIEVTREGHPPVPLGHANVDPALLRAIARGALDVSILDPDHAAEQRRILDELRARRRADPTNSLTATLLEMRDEEGDR